MRARTWPVLRLVFPAPLDDATTRAPAARRRRLQRVGAGRGRRRRVAVLQRGRRSATPPLDLLAARGWLVAGHARHRGRARRRLGRAIAGQPAGDPRRPDHRRAALGRADSGRAATICWSSKSSRRPASAPDTTSPRGSACGRCRHSICEALACSTSARARACWPWRPSRLGAAEALGIDNDPDAIESAEDTLRRNGLEPAGAVRMELRGLDDPALVPADVRVRQPHRCAAPPAGRARAGAARAGWPRRAQRLHRRRGPLGPRGLRRLRRRGDATTKSSGSLTCCAGAPAPSQA